MPKIDLANIPGLETAQGLYGSLQSQGGNSGDIIVDIMVYIYNTDPPQVMGLF